MQAWMRDIPESDRFARVTQVKKGWSGEEKYHVLTHGGEEWLLRVARADAQARKAQEYAAVERVHALGLNTPAPIGFGQFGAVGEIYELYSWAPGVDAQEALPGMDSKTQYRLGCEAGRMLRAMHSLSAPEDTPPWETHFAAKLDARLARYEAGEVHYPGGQAMVGFVQDNLSCIKGRPNAFGHGDYHAGNMVVDGGKLWVIDFNRFDYGDPWEEFNRIPFCVQTSRYFASGRVDGYFGGSPPEGFFTLMALYIAANALGALPWAQAFGRDEVQHALAQGADILAWHDGMRSAVPTWYARP